MFSPIYGLTFVIDITSTSMLKFLSLSVHGVDSCIFEPTSVANSVIPVTLKNCTLDILCPHKCWFIHRSCHWYSALNKANGTSLSGCNICAQYGGKQHTSTLCPSCTPYSQG